MAYGIEEIAEMQVTGPVQGGDMVAKPNEMPVGAAALLNKMQKKNTPGVFKLPSPDKDMPDFMKVAAEGVERETAQGDTINIMAGELMRQGIDTRGMGMDDVIRIYEQTFGSPGDVDEFGVSAVDPSDWRTILRILEAGGDPGTETAKVDPSDWRSILKMLQSGMSEEQIQEQMAMNTMKGRIRGDVEKVEAFAPEGEQLAYINPEEAEVLRMMGGSGEPEPITGVASFKKRTRKERKADNIRNETLKRAAGGDTSDYVQRQMANISDSGGRPGGAYETEQAGKAYETFREGLRQAQQSPKSDEEISKAWIKQSLGPTGRVEDVPGVETYSGFEDYTGGVGDKGFTVIDALTGLVKKGYRPYLDTFDSISGVLDDLKIGQVKDFIKSDKAGAGWANLLNQWDKSDDPEGAFQSWLNDHEGAWKDTMLNELKDDPGMEDVKETSFDEVLEFMKTKHGDSKEWQKRFSDDKAKWWKDNPAQTGDSAENMIRNLTMSDIKKAKDAGTLTAQEARRLSYDLQMARDEINKKDDNRGQRGGGGPTEQVTEEETEVVENVTPDERAGSWNLGGTMPYTDDLYTQGTEMNVPLGRRFDIDKDKRYLTSNRTKDDIYKYATEGGYSQLEPFQNYLARRREYLGEDEPVYFDEEGNVSYSDSETV